MTPEQIELKPCPFCGGPATLNSEEDFTEVFCENDRCHIAVAVLGEHSVSQWNTRAPSELEMLRAEVQAAKNRDAYRENLVTELRNERSVLRDENATQAAELTRLRALIEGAPHEPDCGIYDGPLMSKIGRPCNCWKSKSQLNTP